MREVVEAIHLGLALGIGMPGFVHGAFIAWRLWQ